MHIFVAVEEVGPVTKFTSIVSYGYLPNNIATFKDVLVAQGRCFTRQGQIITKK